MKPNSNKMHHILTFGTVMLFLIQWCYAEVYTALADMEDLLETEAVLIGNLEAYIDAQEEKLNYLRRYVTKTKNHNRKCYNNNDDNIIIFMAILA